MNGVTEVKLGGEFKVTDMRKKTDLGVKRTFKVALQPYEAAFYAASRSKLGFQKGVRVKAECR